MDDIISAMKVSFEDNVTIPEPYEYLSSDQLSEAIGGEYDGFGFTGIEHIVYVDCRGLPEQFTIVVLGKGKGEVESYETHESIDAANKATEYMKTFE